MESEEDQHMTLDLAKWIVGKGGKVRAHRFTPLPGTPLAGISACSSMQRGRSGTWAGWPSKEIYPVPGGLEVELLERFAVLFLQLVFYYHFIGHYLNLFHRLGEEEPEEAPIRELVSVR